MAVCDGAGNMIAFARMDGAPLGATELAVNKAHTAALWEMKTGEFQRSTQPGGVDWGLNTSAGGRIVVYAGGVPVHVDGGWSARSASAAAPASRTRRASRRPRQARASAAERAATVWGDPSRSACRAALLHGSRAGAAIRCCCSTEGRASTWDYLQPLVDELAAGYRVAVYQQRGLPPSTAGPPYDVATRSRTSSPCSTASAGSSAVVAGHSWGGHLLLHLLAAHPERIAAALAIDTLGGVGDGGEAEFDAEMLPPHARRAISSASSIWSARPWPARQRRRPHGVDAAALAGVLRRSAPRRRRSRGMRVSVEAYSATFESLHAELPGLAARLAGVAVPTVLVHGAGSPMPVTASTDTAAAIGSAAVIQVLGGAGHFPWIERPGRAAGGAGSPRARPAGPDLRR